MADPEHTSPSQVSDISHGSRLPIAAKEPLEQDRTDRYRGTRLPLSCRECSRRKIKCDKTIPCRPCRERGEGNLCQRRALPRPRPVTQAPVAPNGDNAPLLAEIANLRRRMARVEAALKLEDDSGEHPSQGGETMDFQANGLAGVMEEAALGIGEIQRLQGVPELVDAEPIWEGGQRWFSSTPLSACLAALPSQPEAQALIDAFCKHLNWMCGCVHVPTLTRLNQEFWTLPSRNKSQDGMFLALLFSILSNAAYLLEDEQIETAGLDISSIRQSGSVWFDCCIATFFRCDGITRPSLMACQAMVTLNYAFHTSGNTRAHVAISNIIAGTARAMNLHLLGREHTGSVEEVVRREIGRRVWWHITETEWYFFAYHRYSSITPNQFNTAMPGLMDDGTFTSSIKDDKNPNELWFILASAQSSRVLYDLYCTLQPTQNPSYEAVLDASEKLQSIRKRFPTDPEPPVKLGGQISKHHIIGITGMTLAYRLYLIHRSYFVKSLNDPAYQQSYTTCLSVAETILSLADRGIPLTFYRLWDITLYLIAAGIVLSLDLLATNAKRTPPEILSRRGKLNTLVDLLNNLGDQSGIGSRGATLITHLCAMDREIAAGSASRMRITRDEILNLVYPDKTTHTTNWNSPGQAASHEVPADAGSHIALDISDGNGMYGPRSGFSSTTMDLATGLPEDEFAPTAWGGSDAGLNGFSFDVFGVPLDRDRLFGFFSDLMPE
ncbi:Agnestins biosynthesis cluster transcription factor AgnL11 [Paramyrothecium foliicola]|nr:Agnestins biosynthesis cluster transcription factor AgnL11 [Paramyrothecium foliicola]